MFNTFLSFLIVFGLKENIVVFNGSAVPIFQREKQYLKFRFKSILFLILGVLISCISYYFLYTYVYLKYNLVEFSFTISVLIVGLYNLIVAKIFNKFFAFDNYLYTYSFSYAFDFVFTLSVLLTIDFSLGIAEFMMQLAAVVVSIFVTYILMGFFVKSSNRGFQNNVIRNIPLRLFLFVIFGLLFYFASQMIV